MGFGDLSGSSGLESLNSFLATKSYIEGYVPSQADAVVFAGLSSAPAGELYPHALRWYKHIASYGDEKSSFPGVKKSLDCYGPAGNAAPKSADPDDDFDLFGSDGEDDDAEKIKQDRLAAYDAKKKAKPGPIAKSGLVLDVKPWDDETDMAKVEECVRSIVMDGLLWGVSKLVPVGYGIKKLQIAAVIEDDKVSTETLEEEITAFEDFIQSMDIAAFNKI